MGSTVSLECKNDKIIICAFVGPTSNLLDFLLYTNGIVYGYSYYGHGSQIKFHVHNIKHINRITQLCGEWYISIAT